MVITRTFRVTGARFTASELAVVKWYLDAYSENHAVGPRGRKLIEILRTLDLPSPFEPDLSAPRSR